MPPMEFQGISSQPMSSAGSTSRARMGHLLLMIPRTHPSVSGYFVLTEIILSQQVSIANIAQLTLLDIRYFLMDLTWGGGLEEPPPWKTHFWYFYET